MTIRDGKLIFTLRGAPDFGGKNKKRDDGTEINERKCGKGIWYSITQGGIASIPIHTRNTARRLLFCQLVNRKNPNAVPLTAMLTRV